MYLFFMNMKLNKTVNQQKDDVDYGPTLSLSMLSVLVAQDTHKVVSGTLLEFSTWHSSKDI